MKDEQPKWKPGPWDRNLFASYQYRVSRDALQKYQKKLQDMLDMQVKLTYVESGASNITSGPVHGWTFPYAPWDAEEKAKEEKAKQAAAEKEAREFEKILGFWKAQLAPEGIAPPKVASPPAKAAEPEIVDFAGGRAIELE